jgi:hypothetical protein
MNASKKVTHDYITVTIALAPKKKLNLTLKRYAAIKLTCSADPIFVDSEITLLFKKAAARYENNYQAAQKGDETSESPGQFADFLLKTFTETSSIVEAASKI